MVIVDYFSSIYLVCLLCVGNCEVEVTLFMLHSLKLIFNQRSQIIVFLEFHRFPLVFCCYCKTFLRIILWCQLYVRELWRKYVLSVMDQNRLSVSFLVFILIYKLNSQARKIDGWLIYSWRMFLHPSNSKCYTILLIFCIWLFIFEMALMFIHPHVLWPFLNCFLFAYSILEWCFQMMAYVWLSLFITNCILRLLVCFIFREGFSCRVVPK